MHYSFVDKQSPSEYTVANPTGLYNSYQVCDPVACGLKVNNKESCCSEKLAKDYYWSLFTPTDTKITDMNNWATEGSIQKSIMKSISTPSPLGELYFSPENINRLQKMIKYEVYKRSNGKYVLRVDQKDSDLLIVMRAVFITDAENSPYRLVHQVKELNKKTLNKILPDMITAIKQDEEYINQLDKPIDPIPLPVNINRKGRLSLPSVTTTFF